MDKYELREALNKAYLEGFQDGVDQTFDYVQENYEIEDEEVESMNEEDSELEDAFDLEEEYESYAEGTYADLKKKLNNVPGKVNFSGIKGNGKQAYKAGVARIKRVVGNVSKAPDSLKGYIKSRAKLLKRKINK